MVPLLAFLSCAPPIDENTPADDPDSAALDTGDSSPPVDSDGDGYVATEEDCDDGDPRVHPLRAEDCNGVDDNCNGLLDEGWPDADADGVADCLDGEGCDGRDNDGDGLADEGFPDADADGLADCMDAEDCDGRDNDGDGGVDEGFDGDGDGWPACAECDDADASISPGAADVENGRDDDCDGLVDDGAWVTGDLLIVEVMANPQDVGDDDGEWFELYNASSRDLDINGLLLVSGDVTHAIDADGGLLVAPGEAVVLGNALQASIVDYVYADVGLSNEFDSLVVIAGGTMIDRLAWDDGASMPDAAGASMMVDPWLYGSTGDPASWCAATLRWGPGQDRGSPGVDNEPCHTLDHDGDGWSGATGDCDDADASILPGATDAPYDGLDRDCDGWSDYDADRDTFDAAGWGGDDCDDADPTRSPAAREVCDAADTDEDCDGLAEDDDASATGFLTFYMDADGDSWGDGDGPVWACDAAAGWVAVDGDCDDGESDVNPGRVEVCANGRDDDCDGESGGCGPGGLGTLADADLKLTGEAASDVAGYAVASAGDLDGDGAVELLVGAYMSDLGAVNAGAAYLVTVGASGGLSGATARLLGVGGSDYAGRAMGPAGDYDGDGQADVYVGASGSDAMGVDSGAVYLLSGTVTGDVSLSAADARLLGEGAGDLAGCAIAGLGDVDGDELADLVVGASSDDDGGTGAGAAILLPGGVLGDVSLADGAARLVGEDRDDAAATELAPAGDIDGDGIEDVLVGACGDDDGGSAAGAAYLVLMPVTGTLDLSSADAKLTGESASDGACRTARGGDLDGDGADDVVVGASAATGTRLDAGAVYIFVTMPGGAVSVASADTIFLGENTSDYAGYSLSGSGDVNDDGAVDLVVGTHGADAAGVSAGAASVIFGPVAIGSFDLADADWRMLGESASDYAGLDVVLAGDADGDGFDDVLVGAPYDDDGSANAGAAYVLFGGEGW